MREGLELHHTKGRRIIVGATSSRYDGKLSINSVPKGIQRQSSQMFLFLHLLAMHTCIHLSDLGTLAN